MKLLLCTVAVLGMIASAGAALAEGGCHGTRLQQSAESPPPPPPPATPTT